MKMDNPLQMNDWGIRKFLKVVLAIHVLMWILLGLDALGIHIPVITEVIGFIYLIFIPGFLILRLLKLHNLGSIKTLLISAGLSVTFSMLVGLLMNTIYPLVGIFRPLSPIPFIITFSFITLTLCALSYVRDRDFAQPTYLELRDLIAPPALFLLLLPFLTILGAFLVRFHNINIILLLLVVIIAGVLALVAFNRFIGRKYYPLAIFMIAIAILYHLRLSFSYLWGTDIQLEYYVYRFVEVNSCWTPSVPVSLYNSMLSITILPVAYSSLLAIDGLEVFKLMYPLLFALVPLGLYELYQKQTDEKTAFLSVFFFMSCITFSGEMTHLMKMQTAGLFFTLLIMLMLSKELNSIKRVALVIIFSFSLLVSHYGVAYFYSFYILVSWFFTIFVKKMTKQSIRGELLAGISIVFFLVTLLVWYTFISGGVALRAVVPLVKLTWYHLSQTFIVGPRDPRILQGMGLAPVGLVAHSFLREVAGWLHRITYLMIIVGVFKIMVMMVKRREVRFITEHLGMTIAGLITLLAAILIPVLSYSAMNTSRIYFVALFLLSPFCILGGETIFAGIKRIFRQARRKLAGETIGETRACLYLTLLILIPYFLFNIGFVFEVTGDYPNSQALSLEKWKTIDNESAKLGLYNSYQPVEDVYSIRWLSKHQNDTAKIYSDKNMLYHYGKLGATYTSLYRVTEIDEEAYIQLRYLNTIDGLMRGGKRKPQEAGEQTIIYSVDTISPLLEKSSRIYSNGGSEIYYTLP